ncbi:alpha/beta hydrolase family protein [Kribbella amoyensis]|uniref:Alpha/beta hydrolase family protein n=1 Tax=Kribbella amoyensis TaxID=996641 RepID=A0A561BKM1_9ACTN|nr:alpha/beta fold hydrolase [Kribbella amoyensis]TWD79427.1 alpha/beta hydrolase family protein [Kribbella amoyensis]
MTTASGKDGLRRVDLPRVDLVAAPPDATDLILVAHGGMETSTAVAHAWRAPILRMWPFAVAARAAVPGAAVGLMRYRYRGWNEGAADPVLDLRAVLDRLPSSIARVVLVGHSMGGRAVVAVSNHPRVAGVLGLAPWLPSGEPLVVPDGRIAFAHGDLDRITDPRGTAAYAQRLRAEGAEVALFTVEGENHAMLRRSADWSELVRRFVADTLTSSTDELFASADQVLPHWRRAGSMAGGVLDIARARLRLRVVGQL